MPFVNVNLLNGRSTEEKDAIATSIQAALVGTLDVSDANRIICSTSSTGRASVTRSAISA